MTLCTELRPEFHSPLEQAPGFFSVSLGQMQDSSSPESEYVLMGSALYGESFSFRGPKEEHRASQGEVHPLVGGVHSQVVIEELEAAHGRTTEVVCGLIVDNRWTHWADDPPHGDRDQSLCEIAGFILATKGSSHQGDRFPSIVGNAFDHTQDSVESAHFDQKRPHFGGVSASRWWACGSHVVLGILHASEKASRQANEGGFIVDALATVELGFRPKLVLGEGADQSRSVDWSSLQIEWG